MKKSIHQLEKSSGFHWCRYWHVALNIVIWYLGTLHKKLLDFYIKTRNKPIDESGNALNDGQSKNTDPHGFTQDCFFFFTKKTRTLGPVKILMVVQTSCFFKTFVKAKYVSWSNQNYLQVYAISAVCFQSSKKRQRQNGPECVKWTAWFVLALILLSGGRERFLHVIIKKHYYLIENTL